MDFYDTTAEHVLGAARAVVISPMPPDKERVAKFLDTTEATTTNALGMASELGMIREVGGAFESASALVRYVDTDAIQVRAAALRIFLESYEPFRFFVDRIRSGATPSDAADAAVALLNLNSHRDSVKATLIDLGSYTQVFAQAGGGLVHLIGTSGPDLLLELAKHVHEFASATSLVREQTGATAHGITLPEADVVLPLATSLERARDGDGDSAVQQAGNAVESFLVFYGTLRAVQIQGNGIGQKANDLRSKDAAALPVKVNHTLQCLSAIRNAADHGTDADTGASWTIAPETGRAFVALSLQVIHTMVRINAGGPYTM